MALLLILVLVLVVVGVCVRSRRFTAAEPEQGRWWDQPAEPVAPVRDPYEQGGRG